MKKAKKDLPANVAEKLHALINLIESSANLQDIAEMQIYHLHPLQGKRDGQYALDIGRCVLPADVLRDAVEKCFEADVGWHGRHIFADEHHAKAAVGAVVVNVQRCLAGAAVDDGGKVWGDDDAVLTCCQRQSSAGEIFSLV